MFGSLLRSAGAVLAGLAVAFLIVVGVEAFSSVVHPFPPGVDPADYDACKAHVARYPAWVLAVVVATWGLTAFVGAWVATRLGAGRARAHGLVVGLILVALVVFNMSLLPYPGWFWAANVVALPLGFYWGSRWGRPWPATGGS